MWECGRGNLGVARPLLAERCMVLWVEFRELRIFRQWGLLKMIGLGVRTPKVMEPTGVLLFRLRRCWLIGSFSPVWRLLAFYPLRVFSDLENIIGKTVIIETKI
jgi:hypothetical protein